MAQGTDEMMKMSAAMAQTTTAMAHTALEGMRRLSEVNLQAARASLEQSAVQINALLSAKDVNTLTQLVTAMAQPSPEKFTAYAQAVAAIAQDTQSDFARMVREQVERTNQQIATAVATMARSAPAAGTDGGMNFIQQAMQSATSSYEQLNQNMQRMMEMGGQAMQQAQGAAPDSKAPTATPSRRR